MGVTQYNLMPISVVGDEASQIFFNPFYEALSASEFGQIFTRDSTIPYGGQKQTLFAGLMTPAMRLKAGCGSSVSGTMTIGGKMLTVRPIEAFISVCKDDMQRSALQQLGSNSANYDLRNSVLMNIAITRLQQANMKQIIDNALFGSIASLDATMNLTDGLFSVLLPQAIGNGTPNITTFGGAALGAGDAVEYLNKMIEAQTKELRGVPAMNKMLIVSQNVENALIRDLQAGAIGSSTYTTTIVDGVATPMFRGIPLKVIVDLDDQWFDLNAQTNGNLALLTAKGNLQMGDSGSAGETYEQFYDQKDQINLCTSRPNYNASPSPRRSSH